MTENKTVEEILDEYRRVINYLNTHEEDDTKEYDENADDFWGLSEFVMVHGTEEDKQSATEWAKDCEMVWNGERWETTTQPIAEFDAWVDAWNNNDNSDDLFAELVAHANAEPEPETDIEDTDSDADY